MKITLCGSTKFLDLFHQYNVELTLAGHLVYSIATSTQEADNKWTDEEKEFLDMIHFMKIAESDAIFVIDKDEYIGYSTGREMKWAELHSLPIILMSIYEAEKESAKTGNEVPEPSSEG